MSNSYLLSSLREASPAETSLKNRPRPLIHSHLDQPPYRSNLAANPVPHDWLKMNLALVHRGASVFTFGIWCPKLNISCTAEITGSSSEYPIESRQSRVATNAPGWRKVHSQIGTISYLGFFLGPNDHPASPGTILRPQPSDVTNVGSKNIAKDSPVNRATTRALPFTRPPGGEPGGGFFSDPGDTRSEPECFAGGTRSC
jgi:hypothetical protein